MDEQFEREHEEEPAREALPEAARVAPEPGGARQAEHGAEGRRDWKAGVRQSLKGRPYAEQRGMLGGSVPLRLPPTKTHPGLDLALSGRAPQAPRQEKAAAAVKVPEAKPAAAAEAMTGLRTQVSLDRFVAAARKVQTDWPKLDKQQRGQQIGDAANVELKAASVPETGIDVKSLPTNDGQLNFQTWDLALNVKRYEQPALTSDQAAKVSDTVYHEARHAEQWHRMARIEAGKGKKGDEIARGMSIPKKVADDAAAKPLKGDTQEAKEGTDWYESVYGAKATARNTTLNDLSAKGLALNALSQQCETKRLEVERLNGDATATADARKAAHDDWKATYDRYQVAYADYDVTYRAYRALPEEKDAWAAGGTVSGGWAKGAK